MIIVRKLYSKLEDEDFIDHQNEKKKSVRHAKAAGAVIGGFTGAGLGGTLGSISNNPKVALAGAGVGAVAGGIGGYHLGKHEKKRVERSANSLINKYNKASQKDKKYLRDKIRHDEEMEVRRQQAAAMNQMAMNSYRW